MGLGRRDVGALLGVAVIVGGTVASILRIHAADDQAGTAGVVQGELAPVAIALVLLPLLVGWWWRGRGGHFTPAFLFERRYRAYVAAVTREVDLRGLVSPPEVPVRMDEVYVDVSVARRPVREVASGLVPTTSESPDRQSIWDFVARPEPAVLALVGGPGTGKSTLLRHLARALPDRDRVPVLLELRRHAADIVADPRAPLWQIWRLGLGDLAAREPKDWLRGKLERGRCVVLLDGLDEVPSPADDDRVRDWIADQIGNYPGNDFVVTSRPHDYASAPIRSATTLEVRGLTDEQIRAFVENLHRALPPPHGDTEDLITRLHTRPELAEFATNPLLLTMIVLTHRAGGTLPDNRADLYAEVCAGVLQRRALSERWGSGLDPAAKERALAALAYAMTEAGVHEQPSYDMPDQARALLTDAGANGLLIETRRHTYAFAHRSIQEYLTARHIADNGLEAELAARVADDWWRETLLLYAAGTDPDPIVRACLDQGGGAALSLALECATGEAELAERVDQAVADLLARDAGSTDRRLLIQSLAHRELGPLVPAGADRRVGRRPVSQRIYQLFLDDTGHPRPDRRWDRPDPGRPAEGLWPGDAAAFVNWLNALGGVIRYAGATPDDLSALQNAGAPSNTVGGPDWSVATDDTATAHDLLRRLTRLHAMGICDALAALPADQGNLARMYGICLRRALDTYDLVADGLRKDTPIHTLGLVKHFGNEVQQEQVKRLSAQVAGLPTACRSALGASAGRLDAVRAHPYVWGHLRLARPRPPIGVLDQTHTYTWGFLDDPAPELFQGGFHRFVSVQVGDAVAAVVAPEPAGEPPGSESSRFPPPQPENAAALVAALIRAGLPEAGHPAVVDLAGWPDACDELRSFLKSRGAPAQAVLADLLQEAMTPALSRERAPTAEETSRAFWCAVVIAAGTEGQRPHHIAELARTAARGMVLLYHRSNGTKPGDRLFLTAT
ncbi:hypothetical protein Aab01nite_08210 [Paractinoplanes abujensis]|uniref:Energy-coupling factor transporter ATP-binding protein EcfA2 n=1 Tax=Paractinoplanes abujensis TaxID=882441 RepID=A0A7W7CQE4_9ACTN|nr:NACHT domain-containing protein [Actinoplanes abujensis]MBB4691353.1 energy-coupling factor transporter ATP-binding protein EcfA2 [Actinoplanes abujensis]GID17231.1 hypothetical protein Aab01nite_08210 [Actinoplanes abujensis]